MRRLLFVFLLLNSVCFGQKSVSYKITEESFSEGKLIQSKSTYFTLSKNKSASKKEFPSEIRINAIEYKDSRNPFFFSSFYPDSNQNVLSSSILVDILTNLQQPIRFNFQHQETIVDTSSLRKEILSKAKYWQLSDDITDMVRNNVMVGAEFLCSWLNYKYLGKDILKRLQSGPVLVKKQLYKIAKNDKKNLYLTFRDTSTLLKGELVVDKKTLLPVMLSRQNEYSYDSRTFINTTKLQVIDTVVSSTYNVAYAEMLLNGSFASKVLYTDEAIDSLKVMDYIVKYDAIFPNDRSFVQRKLSLLQQIKNHKLYDLSLNDAPVNFLAGTHHLLNFLYNGDLSRDKFIAAIPLLDHEKRYDWMQNGLYQHLGRPAKAGALSSDEQTDLLVNYFSEIEKQYTYPMVLGRRIIQQTDNLSQSKKMLNELMDLNDDYWINGNIGRYALLAYQRMVSVDLDYSRQLLADIISKLTVLYNADKTDHRNITRAHLATANYLAFQVDSKSNKQEALNYLEKAALYSPKNQAEAAYNSSYDIMFLKSKKSYAEEYLTELAAGGKKDVALQKYIDEFLTVQGTGYKGLRDFYQHYYPEQKFGEFFIQKVVPQLPDAPDFALANLENSKVEKADLKGKWTLVDFWGTWCGPCVAEMPKLNNFYERLKSDKSKRDKIGFMSIACSDTEDKVKSFITRNNYTIPVLMSDSQVEKNFKVRGYPSKYILTPEGKLIAIPFSFDWQPLLEEVATF
ncbi:TlpA disulfide reductase family protein [Sphingobacterium sp. DR205]|uniref:TlpA family protein disulfide reductase n=1 Tax=Sphingobacterium sp. DR205 TaxID=2713573 RepID=UPI0013E4F069|nr:TlpA disulfide reductase family protein [Sphingobacterium sp. DR205]QIH35275.1 TlpA family protein disulfide reductase [Sphingobacterium sp. DR205]